MRACAWKSYVEQEFYPVLHLFPQRTMPSWQLGALPTRNASTIYVISFSLKVTQSKPTCKVGRLSQVAFCQGNYLSQMGAPLVAVGSKRDLSYQAGGRNFG